MRHWIFALFLATGCGAADTDETLWTSNTVGGGNVFADIGSQAQPTATTGTGGATAVPTNTGTGNPVPTDTSMPTSTSTGTSPFPTNTTTSTATSFPTGSTTTTSTATSTGTATDTGVIQPQPSGNSGPCSLTVDFTTVTYRGWFAPAHVEAAWIEDSSGRYIHTLEEYGVIRQNHLVSWNQASLGQAVDCVTGATITQHRAHTVTWDCIDLQNNPVPDGTYRLMAEFTEDDSAGFFGVPTKKMQIDFPKGAQPADLTVPDSASFVSVRLTYR